MKRLVPEDLTLPPVTQFSKTFVSKQSIEALRLTRHMPMTRLSPIAIFLASKGSTSWEASVKSRPEVVQDDLAPPGWRVLSKGEEPLVDDSRKKPSGGLLSFFGRRGATNTVETTSSERSASPVRPPQYPVSSTPVGVGSPRASLDLKSSATVPIKAGLSSGASSPHTTTFTPSVVKPPEQSTFTSGFSEPSATTQLELPRSSTPPSVVSRFLGRFSRSKPSGSRNSMALSSDDLEFLSDIVPSHNDDVNDVAQLDSLTAMLATAPVQKLPPLIPPPPKLAPPPTPAPAPPSIPASSSRKQPADVDFMSLFDSPSDLPTVPPLRSPGQQSVLKPISPTSPRAISTLPTPTTEVSQSSNPRLAFSDKYPADTPTSFNIPKTPTSRSQTPVVQPKRNVIAIMSNSSSSATPLPGLNSAFSLPGPPSSGNSLRQSQTSFVKSGIPLISPLPPPSAPRPQSPLFSTGFSSSNVVSHNDEDDFADFLSSPAENNGTPTSFSGFSSSFTSPSNFSMPLTGNARSQQNNSYSDFESFESSELRIPSPPLPPEKPTSLFQKPSLSGGTQLKRASPAAVNKPLPPRKVSRAADHQRTLSLMEVAAARGKWPAPPSPLPEAIPPPESSNSVPLDLFNSQSPMQSQQENAMAVLASSVSSPAALPVQQPRGTPHQMNSVPPLTSFWEPVPMLNTPPSASVFATQTQHALQPSLLNQPSSPGSAKNGVLSAQDLSFFEGL